jgi:drug/metabolite transporter superfamily protein YnfA
MSDKPVSDFEKAAAEESGGNLVGEFWGFLRENKKWWMMPILVILLLFGLLILMSGTAAAPFIYTLF